MYDFRTDAALRPQPKRHGLDTWPTPTCLSQALIEHVLPILPAGAIWEPASEPDGALVRALRPYRTVHASDLATGSDFLTTDPPPDCSSLITNPPFLRLDNFLARGLKLLADDNNSLTAMTMLLRDGSLPVQRRAPMLQKAYRMFACCWRPRWIAGTSTSPRWSFWWVIWARGWPGPPSVEWIQPPPGREAMQ